MNRPITWNKYFMELAKLTALRSKDPVVGVGACIVKDNKILSLGYNGFPNGCSDEYFPWSKDSSEFSENKYAYVVHAELNAILNASTSLKDSTLYVTLFPCNECAKAIIQAGIKKVIYLEPYNGTKQYIYDASKRMFNASGVEYIEYKENE